MPAFLDRAWALVCLLALESLTASPALAASPTDTEALARMESGLEAAAAASTPMKPEHLQACVGGMAAGVYPCRNVDLLEFMPHAAFGTAATSVKTNSLWGWTDPETGHEWVLLGLNNGTAFVDVTNPEAPVYAGKLPTHIGTSNTWRDVRVYQNYAYVVSEQAGHGMQVFDLTQLRNVVAPPVTFAETAFYNRVSNTHTISINQDTGYAYLVGTTGTSGNPNVVTCGGNMHIVSLANPASPQFAGCYNDGGYVHENQCFVYHGPDLDCDPVIPGAQACAGREICLAARGSAHNLDVIDVTNHAAPVRLSSLHYNSVGFSHQAWFTEDQRYILLDDELDEQNAGNPTRTYVFDAGNLNAIVPAGGNGYFDHATAAIDHNLYVRGNFVFQSNYQAGLRILALSNLAQSQLTEVGFFDVFPANDDDGFDGTWNNYPFFTSGVIPVSHISQGLYLLRPTNLCTDDPGAPAPTGLTATPNGDHRIDLAWTGSGTAGNRFTVERATGGCGGAFAPLASGLETPSYDDLAASGVVTYGYRILESDLTGFCTSAPSTCVEATTTGSCTAAPTFSGLTSATNDGQASCGITLAWGAATAYCGGPPTHAVYRGTTDTFVPSASNRIAEGVAGGTFHDPSPPPGVPAFYVVRAADGANGSEETNVVRRSATASGPAVDGTFVTGAEVGDPVLDTLPASGGTEAVEHAGWHLSTARFHTGARSFFSTSSSSLCVSLQTAPLTLTAGQASQLRFWTGWDVEPTFDGGIVEVSTNGGATWTRVTPAGGYPNTITQSGNACVAMPPGTPAFSSSNQLAWQQKTVDLAAYAGQTVRLSWRYGSDSGVNREGWYVDDVAVTHVQIPGSCSLPPILVDGFESGGFAAWSAASP